ncbi:hypothetical protein [Bartonella harrusi]|uniref:Uncharacterized protein n=1 Tax=Bartonella harrusi TaxID=2961895 RepID=A0ABY5ESB3_9HYPH|nr:hypothetical protein [Bartonella harrusi]UTO28167.1 hypothetical protein NMK50_08335 [Bartonella harrusi]
MGFYLNSGGVHCLVGAVGDFAFESAQWVGIALCMAFEAFGIFRHCWGERWFGEDRSDGYGGSLVFDLE